MRKVTTINLNNNAYQIDEDGYEALRAYLERAARALAGNPDREEILSDLEQAIADKCLLTIGAHKNVVSTAEIQRILDEMGPVTSGAEGATETADAADAAEQRGSSGAAAPGSSGYRPRRLYRLAEGQKWAGICSGLAAFAGVDVTLVRIAVVLLTVFTGVFPGLFVYFVMIFVVPVAASPEELAAAHDQPFRAQEVVDRVKKKHDDWRSQRSARRERRRMRHSAWWSPQPVPTPVPGYAARVTGGVLLPVLTVLSAVWFAALATVGWVVWHGWHRMGLDSWSPDTLRDYDDVPRWVAVGALVAIYALLAIPIGAARRASLYYANGGRLHGWADAWSGLLWVALVAVLLLGAWFVMPQLQDMLRWHIPGTPVISV